MYIYLYIYIRYVTKSSMYRTGTKRALNIYVIINKVESGLRIFIKNMYIYMYMYIIYVCICICM